MKPMQHQQNATRLAPAIKVAGGAAAFLVHLAVIGMVFYSPSAQLPQGPEDTAEVFFVELSDMITEDIQQAADQPDADSTIQPESTPSIQPEPEPEPVIEPEPEPEPEPVIESEPEPIIESEPKPEPVIQPEPDPEPVIEPEPEPESEPEIVPPPPPPPPKPQPKPKPVVKPVVKPVAKPAAKPVVSAKPQSAPVKSITPEGQDAKTSAPVATAPPSDEPRLVSAVDYLGKRPMPVYPRLSQRRKEQGRVLVRVLISPQGTVMNVAIRSSSGFDQLDQAALKAARTARFKPYTENGVAYRAMADLPFDFVL